MLLHSVFTQMPAWAVIILSVVIIIVLIFVIYLWGLTCKDNTRRANDNNKKGTQKNNLNGEEEKFINDFYKELKY